MEEINVGDTMEAIAQYLSVSRYTLERALMELVRNFEKEKGEN